jgi:lambda family phage minor tail protein L
VTIALDVQSLTPGTLVELFVLDATALGDQVYRFHAGVNALKAPVVWQGNTYMPFPVEASGFERTGKGTLPTPTLRVANVSGLIGALCMALDDLLGATLTRKRTFAKYLDAVNFAGGINPTADPDAAFPDERWSVNRKISENKVFVEFELASVLDVQGVKLPRRQVIANCCTWRYRGAECGYTGTAYFDIGDRATNLENDRCGKRLTSCRARFGESATLPYGGFPGAALL